MKKFTLSLAALSAIAMLSIDTGAAEAAHGWRGYGIHIGGRNVHLDIGRPHGYRTYNTYYGGFGVPTRHVWHNTSHFDYHPTEAVRHGNHFDIVPGHYDYHNTGHWDTVRRGHGGHGGHH